jgi:hypothetical protein
VVFIYGPADWILYTDNTNEYEHNNDARRRMKHHISDLPGNNREMIRNAHLRLELRSFRDAVLSLRGAGGIPGSAVVRLPRVSALCDTANTLAKALSTISSSPPQATSLRTAAWERDGTMTSIAPPSLQWDSIVAIVQIDVRIP